MRIDPRSVSRDLVQRISRSCGVPVGRLLALDPKRDPFNVGTEAQRKRATEFLDVVAANNLLGRHARGVYYRLIDLGILKGTAREWKALTETIGFAHALGLVPPWAFADQRTTFVVRDGRERREIEYEKPTLHLPSPSVLSKGEISGFDQNSVQPVRVQVVAEKYDDDLMEEAVPVCREFGVELTVTTGTSTRARAGRIVQDVIEDGRPLVILWLSDADTSGEHMSVVMGRHLEFVQANYDVPPIYLDRVALTLEQVAEIEAEIGRTIPRAPDAKRSEGRVELNALPVFAPGWVSSRLREALEAVTVEIEEPEVEVPEEIEEMLERAEGLADRLFARDGWKLGVIQEHVERKLEEWEPEIPETEAEEIDLDGRDWILDPTRDYLEQLNAYRRHGVAGRDRSPLELAERTCANCGGSMEHRSVQARFCKSACQRADTRRRRAA